MVKMLQCNGDYPQELYNLAEEWADAGREFYLGPENIFEYNMLALNYAGAEGVSREWGTWSIHTPACPTSVRLSKDDIDAIAYSFGYKYAVKSAILWIGSRCNLACKFCLYHGELKGTWEKEYAHECIELDDSVIRSRIDKLCALGVKDLELVPNGEPFVYKNIFDIIRYAQAKGIAIRILFTNGTVLTEEVIIRLKELGVESLSVSLNAFSFEVWSKIAQSANQRLFTTAVAAPVLARKYGIKTEVSFAVCAENKGEIKPFLDYWRDKAEIVKVCHQLVEDELLVKGRGVDNSSLPYYTCSDLRGRIVVSNSGNIVPCCTVYNALDKANTLKLPLINIDDLDVGQIQDMIDQSYEGKAYKSVCVKCSSFRIPKTERKPGAYLGVEGEISGKFFFAKTKSSEIQ